MLLYILTIRLLFKVGVPNLFMSSYHLGTPYCQRVPLFPEQLI